MKILALILGLALGLSSGLAYAETGDETRFPLVGIVAEASCAGVPEGGDTRLCTLAAAVAVPMGAAIVMPYLMTAGPIGGAIVQGCGGPEYMVLRSDVEAGGDGRSRYVGQYQCPLVTAQPVPTPQT